MSWFGRRLHVCRRNGAGYRLDGTGLNPWGRFLLPSSQIDHIRGHAHVWERGNRLNFLGRRVYRSRSSRRIQVARMRSSRGKLHHGSQRCRELWIRNGNRNGDGYRSGSPGRTQVLQISEQDRFCPNLLKVSVTSIKGVSKCRG